MGSTANPTASSAENSGEASTREVGTTAVLLLAHGTPDVLGEMAEYLSKVTGGRPMPDEVVKELQHRYGEIGLRDTPGTEPPPLTKWTMAQRDGLAAALAQAGTPMPVYAAMRNWHPYIADVVSQMRADGIQRVLTICLAPQNSRTSIGLYRRAFMSAADGLDTTFVDAWSEEPLLIEAFAERLLATYPAACTEVGEALPVLFTAHSVPCRTIMTGEASIAGARPGTPPQSTPDPYAVEAKRTAELVFEMIERQLPKQSVAGSPQWFFAFQSQGVAGGPWIGPTVEDTLTALRDEGHKGVVLQPVGFLCDHVEILYDIDIAFVETAKKLGLRLFRPASLNDSPLLIQALVHVVKAHR